MMNSSSLHRALCRAARRAAGESGQSLIIALVLTSALTISIAAIASNMTSNESAFGRDRQTDRSLNIAEAGLNNGLGVVAQQDPSNLVSTPPGPYNNVSVDGGKVSYSLAKSGSTWTITATGTSPNGKVTRQVQQKVLYTASTTTVDASNVYGDGLFVSGTSGCTNVTGNSTINSNIWVANDLCITGNTMITPSAANTYSLYVGGQYSAVGNIQVGSAAAPMSSAGTLRLDRQRDRRTARSAEHLHTTRTSSTGRHFS